MASNESMSDVEAILAYEERVAEVIVISSRLSD